MQVDAELKALYKADSTVKNLYMEFYHPGEKEPFLTLGGDGRIMGETMKISESLSSSENLDFGSCEATQFEITVIDVDENIIGARLVVYQILQGVYPAEDIYPSEDLYPDGYLVPFGTYIVQSAPRQTNGRYRDILALDSMVLFDVDVVEWYNALPFPLTLREFRAMLCAHIGVKEHVPDYLPNDDMIVEKTIDTAELIARDVLIACEQVNGAFGHFDRNGILQHVIIEPNIMLHPSAGLFPSEDLYPGTIEEGKAEFYDEVLESYLCISCRTEEYTVQQIDTVRIRQEEGDIGAIYGTGNNCYMVEGNFLVFGKTAAELEQIAVGIHSMISGFRYVPFEYHGKGLPYLDIGSLVWIPKDGISTYIMKRTLTGTYALKDDYSATGEEIRSTEDNVNTEIIQLKGRSAILRRTVDEVSATVTNLEEHTEAQFKIMSDEILLKVSKGEVSSQISVESGQVYIGSNRLVVDSTNFKLDSSGNATFSGKVSGASISGSAISGGSFYSDDKETSFGEFTVLSGEDYCLYSGDGSFVLETANAPSGSVARMVLGDGNGTNETEIEGGNITSTGVIRAGVFYDTGKSISQFYDIRPGKSWWNNWTLTATMIDVYDQLDSLSDRTLKENVQDVSTSEALNFILDSRPVTFRFIEDQRESVGFIAQEVEELEHSDTYALVTDDMRTSKKRLRYKNYIPILVAAVQELQNQITELRGKA